MTPAEAQAIDKRNKCHIKSGVFKDFEVQLDVNSTFAAPVTLKKNPVRGDGFPVVLPYSFSFQMRASTGELTVRESIKHEYQMYVRIPRDSFTIIQFNNLDAGDNPTGTWTIQLGFKGEFKLKVVKDGAKRHAIEFDQVISLNSVLYRARAVVLQARYLKVIIPNYRSSPHEEMFNAELARQILNKELLTGSGIDPVQYVGLQKRALETEDRMAEEKRAKLARNNVRLNFHKLPGYQNRWYVRLTPDPSDPAWMLEGQEHIVFYPNSPKSSAVNPSAGLFNTLPTATPGKRGQHIWRGTVFFKDGYPCAAINNVLPPLAINHITAALVVRGITVQCEEEDDPNVVRAHKALSDMLEVFKKQIDYTYQAKKDVKTNYNIPPTGFFLPEQRWLIKYDRPSIPPKPGQNLGDILANPAYQLLQVSHKLAVRNMITSKSGVSIIQGPPATGKTELVSKLIGIALTHCNISTGCIVLAAHTNVAVSVACNRFLKHSSTIFKIDKYTTCLVWTANKTEYARLVQKDLPPELAEITLDAHLDRVAAREPLKYAAYFRGRDEIRQNGRIEGPTRSYLSEYHSLVGIVKKQIRVWFGTLATFHSQSLLFGRDSDIDCALLIIDEASQAHAAAAWLPWHTLDPQHIVLAGDHLQLAPFVLSTEAQWAWRQSLFEQIRADNVTENVMLDLQFRTMQKIYYGTNAFYNNSVRAHSSTKDRPLYQTLELARKRIYFIDRKNHTHPLTMNTHWFDIENGRSVTMGQTSSSTNPLERQFLVQLFGALQKCGVPAKQCMLLTGYQAMFDDLVDDQLLDRNTIVKKVDTAQGDEAGVVGISLVRTLESGGLGFMAQPRRQNVMTSRARDGQYAVGQFEALKQAAAQHHRAWMDWFYNMLTANGSGWHIKFEGPVKFYVDGKPLELQARPPPPPPATTKDTEASTFEATQDAINADEHASSSGGARTPTIRTPRRDSFVTPSPRLGHSPSISVAASPIQTPTPVLSRASQSPYSPYSPARASPTSGSPASTGDPLAFRPLSPSPSPGSPRQATGSDGFPSAFVGPAARQLSGSSSHGGGTRLSSGSQPRRSSILNPEHGRRTSSVGTSQVLPVRASQQAPATTLQMGNNSLFAQTASVNNWPAGLQSAYNTVDGRDAQILQERLKENIGVLKNLMGKNYGDAKRFVGRLETLFMSNDVAAFNDCVKQIRDKKPSQEMFILTLLIAYGMAKLYHIRKIIVPWP